VDIQVEQYSPILPDDYQATSYPVAMFNWTASNPTDQPITVGVMFTWQNDLGPRSTRTNTVRTEDTPLGRMVGIELGNSEPFAEEEDQGSMVLAALETPGVSVSYRSRFIANADGADIWNDFSADGALDNVEVAAGGGREVPGAGVAITFEIQPGETLSAPFVLSWDLPVMTFGATESWFKRYTAFFGRDGDNAWTIAAEGLARNAEWVSSIEAWQNPILDDPNRPLWYKTALFNELYYLADGGSAWEQGRVGEPDPGPDYLGRFAYLECYDYPFYNTFDVDFYGSFALLELWPEIELRIMRDFAVTIPQEDTSTFVVQSSGDTVQRKIVGAVPHDMGSPTEAPWIRNNAFTWQNVNLWKDLPAKFVLRLYRDAILLDQPGLIEELWPDAVTAMDYLMSMDDNGDGIPENDGIPDQTYDTWPSTGISAYSGDLWLSALAAMSDMATRLGDTEAAATYADQLETARALFEETLWNGQYYNYDETSDGIMADQLAGEWYARITGIPVLPDAQVDSALTTIYNFNVLQYNEGQMGAVNGMYPDGTVVSGEQAEEVWVGTTYMAAAHMLYRGLDDLAWGTAYGNYKFTYETGGLWFRTPEAWNMQGFRASMYMRPLAIWAMETALERR
jgi:non-lysosomal glucosylceramidase